MKAASLSPGPCVERNDVLWEEACHRRNDVLQLPDLGNSRNDVMLVKT